MLFVIKMDEQRFSHSASIFTKRGPASVTASIVPQSCRQVYDIDRRSDLEFFAWPVSRSALDEESKNNFSVQAKFSRMNVRSTRIGPTLDFN